MSVLPPEIMSLQSSSREGRIEYSVTHRVICTAPPSVDTAFDVRLMMKAKGFVDGFPLLTDPLARCQGVEIDVGRPDVKFPGRWYWKVVSTFARLGAQGGKNDPEGSKKDNPKDRPARFSITDRDYQGPALRDELGAPILNTADDPVRRERPWSRQIITIDKTVATVNPTWAFNAPTGFKFSRNLKDWNPWGPYAALFSDYVVQAGQGRLDKLTFAISFENGEANIELHAEVFIDEDFHKDRFWSEGFRCWHDEDDKELGIPKVQAQDPRTGMFVGQPVMLDADGRQITDDSPPFEIVKQYFPKKDWAALPI